MIFGKTYNKAVTLNHAFLYKTFDTLNKMFASSDCWWISNCGGVIPLVIRALNKAFYMCEQIIGANTELWTYGALHQVHLVRYIAINIHCM